jgi:glycosyltransferase involved in cell wall biosynthesis
MIMDSLASVVITTKNEEPNIESCLKSIVAQTYKNIEIIVVDNLSADKTKEIAQKYTDKVFDKGPERSAQRNYGMIEKSSGEYVMFVDADMTLSPDLVKDCIAAMNQADCVALYISEIVTGDSFWSQVRRFERSFYDGTVIDGARFFRKDKFIAVGGFDETMSGPEDWDLDKRIKRLGKIGLVPKNRGEAVIYHNESEFNLKKYLNKKSYYAASFGAYIAKWGKADPDLKRQLGWRYRFFWVFIEKEKWRELLIHPILAVGMYWLRFLVGWNFLRH